MNLKPALTLEQQIDQLIYTHHLEIDNRDDAKRILNIVSYYRLSGYGLGLTEPDNKEIYRKGTTLTSIFQLYCFDSHFKNNLIHIIEQLEIQLRTQISNYIALIYGAEGYMQKNNFSDKVNKNGDSIYDNLIKHFQSQVYQQRKTPFVRLLKAPSFD